MTSITKVEYFHFWLKKRQNLIQSTKLSKKSHMHPIPDRRAGRWCLVLSRLHHLMGWWWCRDNLISTTTNTTWHKRRNTNGWVICWWWQLLRVYLLLMVHITLLLSSINWLTIIRDSWCGAILYSVILTSTFFYCTFIELYSISPCLFPYIVLGTLSKLIQKARDANKWRPCIRLIGPTVDKQIVNLKWTGLWAGEDLFAINNDFHYFLVCIA